MAVVRRVLIALGLLVVLLIVAVGVAYAADVPVDATITDKKCMSTKPTVSIVTDVFGIKHTLEMPIDKCSVVQENNWVRYHLRSGHTVIYSSKGGSCVFDSVTIVCSA